MTFQLGDKVRVIKTMPEWRLWSNAMNKFVGKVGEITETDNNDNPPNCKVVIKSGGRWWFPNECLELVTAAPQEFTITEPLQDYERF